MVLSSNIDDSTLRISPNSDDMEASEAVAPTAEEYRSLLQEVAQLRGEIQQRDVAFRNDIVRESRRRQHMESSLRAEFQSLATNTSLDEESPVITSNLHKSETSEITFDTSQDRRVSRVSFQVDDVNNDDSDNDDSDNDIYNDPSQESKIETKIRNDVQEYEGIEIPLLPQDTFSYLAFSKLKSTAMLTSFLVLSVQLITLCVLLVDAFGEGSPGNELGFPAGVNQSTATIQVVALFIITMGQTDLQDSLNTLFMGYQECDLAKNLQRPVKKWRWSISLWIRISITTLALVVTFLMICTESDTTQLLLDFTSIEFVTNLDNIFFLLAAYGYLGLGAQRDATLVLNAKAPALILTMNKDKNARKKRHLSVRTETESSRAIRKHKRFPRFGFTLALFLLMLVGWAIIFQKISSGEFLCQTVFVQFGDDFNADLAPFSGLYDIGYSGRRAEYGEVGHGGYAGTAKFAYCMEGRAWAFTFGENPEDVNAGLRSSCEWKARSVEVNSKTQDSYDIMTTANEQWQVINSRGTLVPFTGFTLQCYDCTNDENFCGGESRGKCVNNRCLCADGWYGRRCEFYEPCEKLEFSDPDIKIVDGRGFASEYNILTTEDGERPEVYDRPIYEGYEESGISHQIFFNGRRWVLTTNVTMLADGAFHGYWSDYDVQYLSANVAVDSREDSTSPDGLEWFNAKIVQVGNRLQGADLTALKPFRFLCAACSNLTNPCLYDGICQKDKSCNCDIGSSGRLCQIPPSGNAKCDNYFNTPEFGYDGGDCCQQTCVRTGEQDCGRGIVTNSLGVESIGYIGFENCRDPSVALAVAGSRTIYAIQQRGVLRCGTILSTPWFYNFMADQCRIISSVVLDDPNAIEFLNFTSDRFTGLSDDQFDIVFWTDYTANRDVFETTAQSPFNFATIPYYFGGFVFAGYRPYAGCADSGDFFSPPCLDMKICLVGGTTWFDTAQEVFPSEFISTYAAFEDTVKALQNGECNVIGGSQVDVDLSSIQLYGFEGADDDYEVGQQLYFKSFEAWLTRSDDRVWSRLTSWIFEALVQAEESNITKATYDQMVTTDAFGDGFTDMFRKAVRVVGNYGELWKKNMPFTKRAGMNLINDGSTGAMLSYDFGRVTDQGPEPSLNGLIQAILERGYLRCGVTGGALGFAEFDDVSSTWTGFDIDICRGIAAALFNGDSSKLDISLLSTNDRSAMINRGTVDLIPGLTRTLEREVNDGVNGDAFDFSPPVFHDGMIFAGLTPYGICAEAQIFDASNELGLDCRNTTICVTTGSTWYQALIGPLGVPEENLFLTTTFVDSLAKHIAGECNVIVGETAKLSMMSLQDAGYPLPDDISEYHMGTTKYTKEPICLMHRSDDPQFSDLIKWIVFGFFYAEENGITSASAFEMPRTKLFGIRLSGIWQDSIEAAGNYAEIYDRNIGAIVPRSGRNLLNELSSPQLFASPGTV